MYDDDDSGELDKDVIYLMMKFGVRMNNKDDTLWVNLKVVARIPPHCRLNCQGQLFQLQENSWWHSLYRRLQGARRAWCVTRLDELVVRASVFLGAHHGEPDYLVMQTHLREAMGGINNLQATYVADITTVAALERVVDKVKLLIEGAK